MIHAPVTIEGRQAWEVAARAFTPSMLGRMPVTTIDRALALRLAEVLGYDARAVALLLPAIEDGLRAAVSGQADPDLPDHEDSEP